MALLAALVLTCALAPGVARAANSEPTVMTRNLYLGADLTPIVTAGSEAEALAAAQTALIHALIINNFATRHRADAIATEINTAKPDLVGLQEVTTIVSPLGSIDYEPVLLGMLPDYQKVSETSESTFGVPGHPELGSLELSNMILKRKRPDLVVTNPRSAKFATQAPIPGQSITRNWQAVDAKLGPKDFVFLNTHLESANNAVSTAQARELIAGPLRSTKPVIAVGDYNSGPGTISGAFNLLTAPSQGKMQDAASGVGFTCCFPELLTTAGSLDQRIDLVLTNPASVKTLAQQRVGAAQVSGIYPSDHAGVVATLRVP
jgi:endonuclease/exonuclease/phosphatase family metal-dependent hydrolase